MFIRVTLKFISFFLGCGLCFLIHTQFGISSVIASCIVGLLGTLIPIPKVFNKNNIQGAIYSGSFAGMCSIGVLTSYLQIGLLSLLGAIIYLLTIDLFDGVGGKLGTVAFVSVSLVYLIEIFV